MSDSADQPTIDLTVNVSEIAPPCVVNWMKKAKRLIGEANFLLVKSSNSIKHRHSTSHEEFAELQVQMENLLREIKEEKL